MPPRAFLLVAAAVVMVTLAGCSIFVPYPAPLIDEQPVARAPLR